MNWFRRAFWFVAIVGWLLIILYQLVDAHPAGEVIASCITAVSSLIAAKIFSNWFFGVSRQVRRHLGTSASDAALLQHKLLKRESDDMIRALYAEAQQSQRRAMSGLAFNYQTLQETLASHAESQKIEWISIQTGPEEWEEVPTNGAYFLTLNGLPFVAAVTREQQLHRQFDEFGDHFENPAPRNGAQVQLQIVAENRDACCRIRSSLLHKARGSCVYRKRHVVVRPDDRQAASVQVDFQEIAPVTKADIILPEEIFSVVARVGTQQLASGDLLERAGHRSRTAILLHGPPGTGKTLLTRHVVTLNADCTVITLHGFQRGLVREAFRLARYCQPSAVVIEDVDLIAVRRQRNRRGTSLLHELLDELDGLAPHSRTLVLMTTNRPQALEPALASRPGRISQAIEIPLPDAECRYRIMSLFTTKIDASAVDLNEWVSRTEGASPAFLEELIRRAILFSAEDCSDGDVRISEQNLADAMNEIVTTGGVLTRKMLGYADVDPSPGPKIPD